MKTFTQIGSRQSLWVQTLLACTSAVKWNIVYFPVDDKGGKCYPRLQVFNSSRNFKCCRGRMGSVRGRGIIGHEDNYVCTFLRSEFKVSKWMKQEEIAISKSSQIHQCPGGLGLFIENDFISCTACCFHIFIVKCLLLNS